jgi:hypothetical protein
MPDRYGHLFPSDDHKAAIWEGDDGREVYMFDVSAYGTT